MADNSPQLQLEIVLDDGTVKKAFARVVTESKDAGKKSGQSFLAGFNISKGLSASLGSLRTQLIALGGVFTATFATSKLIEAAKIQEQAAADFNTALKLSGNYSKEASDGFQAYAAQLEAITTIGDEVILKNAALIEGITRLDGESLKSATSAALDLSAALNIDLTSASRNIAKTYSGQLGELGELIPALKTLTAEQLKNGAAVEMIGNLYGGASQEKVKTFSGAMLQFGNTLGTVFEDLGNFIVKNPLVIAAIQVLSRKLVELSGFLKNSFESGGLDQFNEKLLTFGSLIDDYVIWPAQKASQAFVLFFNLVQTGLATLATAAAKTLGFLSTPLKLVGVNISDTLFEIGDASSKVLDDLVVKTNESFQNLINPENAASIKGTIKEITDLYRELRNVATPPPDENDDPNGIAKQVEGYTYLSETLLGLKEVWKDLNFEFDRTKATMEQTAKQIAATIKNNMVNGITKGIQSVVGSIMNGENAFQNFGKVMMGVMGDMATQLGTVLIGAGIGVESLKTLGGAAAIAAGIGLVAIGAVLSSLAGSGTTSTPTSSGSSDYVSVAQDADYTSTYAGGYDQAPAEPPVQVTFNVQGSVLGSDKEELGIYFADLLKELNISKGVRFA